ncbi:hypothetical protein HGB47_10845 [Leptospira yasudae]|uniref:hypothetical protein n=1 Tax=Leptospira yasudae TaxID=2202201 RepID=UPI001C4EFB1F|nr:hypothetical protein [Leptospira yasudae]MBW0434113.1 hypothetical protein [Leptospira yasudae]
MIAIVSHDAGGAEILSSYVKKYADQYSYVLEGPAVNVFERKLGKIHIVSLEDAILKSEKVITGTSWQSDIEKRAISRAKSKGIKVASFLDHWVNYRERFTYKDQLVLPDEIWTGDDEAKKLAQAEFPNAKVYLLENPYFESLQDELSLFKTKKKTEGDDLLFVCENIKDHSEREHGSPSYWGFTEEDAIDFFFENIKKITNRLNSCVFRPHPSDPSGKYDWVLKKYDFYPVQISNEKTLFEQIAQADIVLGCESMAMVMGLLAGKKTISCIPPQGKKISLPQKNIIELRHID